MNRSFLLLTLLLLLVGCPQTEAPRHEGTEPGDCSDGADNDADGYFDCKDDGCAGAPACTGGDHTAAKAEPTPAGPSTETADPTAEGSAAKAEPVGHCAPGERAFFSCPVLGGKTLSLCGSDPGPGGWLQYRFGPPGAPELSWPEDRAYGQFTYQHVLHSRSESDTVAFVNGSFLFQVIFQEGGIDQNFAGVLVDKSGEEVSRKECARTPTVDLAALAEVLPAPPRYVAGTYRNERGMVEVKDLGGGRLVVTADVNRGPPSYNMAGFNGVSVQLEGDRG